MKLLLSFVIFTTFAAPLSAERYKHYSEIDEPYESMIEDSVNLQGQQHDTLRQLIQEIRLLRQALLNSNEQQKALLNKQNMLLERLLKSHSSSTDATPQR